jgi:hypothetical protein
VVVDDPQGPWARGGVVEKTNIERKEITMSEWRFNRYKEAYLEMAKRARYRPGAPSDGMGNIDMTDRDFRDPVILNREASKYAIGFLKEDDDMEYYMGCPHGPFNKAFFYAIEVARLLCGGVGAEEPALELLKMATEELKTELKARTTPKKRGVNANP